MNDEERDCYREQGYILWEEPREFFGNQFVCEEILFFSLGNCTDNPFIYRVVYSQPNLREITLVSSWLLVTSKVRVSVSVSVSSSLLVSVTVSVLREKHEKWSWEFEGSCAFFSLLVILDLVLFSFGSLHRPFVVSLLFVLRFVCSSSFEKECKIGETVMNWRSVTQSIHSCRVRESSTHFGYSNVNIQKVGNQETKILQRLRDLSLISTDVLCRHRMISVPSFDDIFSGCLSREQTCWERWWRENTGKSVWRISWQEIKGRISSIDVVKSTHIPKPTAKLLLQTSTVSWLHSSLCSQRLQTRDKSNIAWFCRMFFQYFFSWFFDSARQPNLLLLSKQVFLSI